MFLKLYTIAFAVFLAIDSIWLTLVAKKFYSQQIGFLMKQNPNLLAALLFYLLFIVGIVVFVIIPSVDSGSWKKALITGALFGLVTYATYDLTNLATVKNWPILVTIVDLVWGTVLSASVAVITFIIYRKIN